MQKDFHYYATYCAAYIAGYTHEESLDIAYSAQFVDLCSRTYLAKIKAPLSAATTQLQLELMDSRLDLMGLQDITRIWASFHFLPYDLYAEKKHCSKRYLNKYRLICNTNGELVKETVGLAKKTSLQSVGIAMHILADTWAHRYFAGTPSYVINNTNRYFFELLPDGKRPVRFRHSASAPDDLEHSIYTNTIHQPGENTIMNLGHGRAGHLPDYSLIKYEYLPVWNDYEEIVKDNPHDYMHAFAQMVYAMQCIRCGKSFETHLYAWDDIEPYKEDIEVILQKRQLDSCADWKAFGEGLTGCEIPDFELSKHEQEYVAASEPDNSQTFLGKFIIAALAQKSMVTNRIYASKNMLAGFSVDYAKKGFKGIRDFIGLVNERSRDNDEAAEN